MAMRRFFDPEAGRDLIIDPDIPGQIGWEALIGLARVAARVPKGGIVVEVGSLYGRSSFIWAMNTDPTTKVYCFDPWVREDWIVEVVEKAQQVPMPFSIEAHRYYTKDCPNIIRVQGYSPESAADWATPIDLYFEDSDHREPTLSKNWSFWTQWLKPGGILCGDEFHPDYPEVLAKIAQYEKLWNTQAQPTGLFWWMRKPDLTSAVCTGCFCSAKATESLDRLPALQQELARQEQRAAELEMKVRDLDMTLSMIHASRAWKLARLLAAAKQLLSPRTTAQFLRSAGREGLSSAARQVAGRLRASVRLAAPPAPAVPAPAETAPVAVTAAPTAEAPAPQPPYDPYEYIEPLKPIAVAVEKEDVPASPANPSFSVITTVKDEALNIVHFLKSIEAQEVRPDEVVVVDGGSSDGTAGLVEQFAAKSCIPIRLYVEPGANVARGRNLAIRYATHEIIVSVDAGCRLEPRLFQNLVGCFRLHPDADLVGGSFVAQTPSEFSKQVIPDWDAIGWHKFLPSARNVAFRKSIALRIGGFPEEFTLAGEDTLFDLNYRRVSKKWVFTPRAVVKWRAPQTREESLRLGYSYGKGDGESGFGDLRYHEALAEYRRGRQFDRESLWSCSFHGYLEGRQLRAKVDIERRGIHGLIIILSGVPMTDSGGGQRGAQLALEFIHQGFKVIYVNIYPSYEAPHRIFFDVDCSRLELYHINDFDMAETLRRYEALTRPAAVLLEFPHPQFLPLVRQTREGKVRPRIIYDYIDNWDTSLGGEWYTRGAESRIIAEADLLVASAGTLEESLRGKTDRPIHLIPNAVNLRLFDAGAAYVRPDDLPDDKPIALYVGGLWGQWFDWPLLEQAAQSLPDVEFVLIGNIDEQRKQDVESRHANIRFLGLKLQMQLPAYLHFASVCVIPFKNDNITKYVNPLKVYEYLAMGKPVVSAGLVEVASIPGVVSVADAAHFSAAVREALTAPMDTKSVCAFVEANSWTARVRQFCACLESSPPPSRRTT